MKKALFYILFAFACVVLFLFTLFPGQQVTRYAEEAFRDRVPGMSLSLEEVRPALPWSLEARGLTLEKDRETVFRSDKVKITPAPWSLFSGKPRVTLSSRAYGGEIVLHAKALEKGAAGPLDLSLKVENFSLKGLQDLAHAAPARDSAQGGVSPFDLLPTDREIRGTLDARAEFSGDVRDWIHGRASGNAEMQNGEVALFADVLGLDSLAVSKLTGSFEMDKGVLAVNNVELTGREVNGEISGKVRLAKPLNRSNLDFTGSVKPQAALFKKIGPSSPMAQFIRSKTRNGSVGFKVTGPIGQQRVAFQ